MDPTLIAAQDQLDELLIRVRDAGVVALDTEFMRERTYRARLCLVQIAAGDDVFVVDPVDDLELQPVADLVADRVVEVVVHAGRQDLEIFSNRFGVVPKSIFDVQIAAGFTGRGASLSYGALVKDVLGKTLHKGEAYTDWCRRPLTRRQMQYAGDDVRWLVPAADALKRELRERNRLEWALQEMSYLEEEETYRIEPDEAWRRVSGRGALNGRQLAVLKELAAWREKSSMERDLPRGWVVKDVTLIEIARRQPSSMEALAAIRGMNGKEVARSGREILGVVAAGREASAPERAPAPDRAIQARTRVIAGLADVVVRTRCERAGIAPELVATRGDIESVLVDLFANSGDGAVAATDHRLLQGWRRELAGDAVLDVARGKLGVRSIDRPPYIEEIDV